MLLYLIVNECIFSIHSWLGAATLWQNHQCVGLEDQLQICRDIVLGLGLWLSLMMKLQSLVLALALCVESLVLALNFKSLVESFCHSRLVVQWYWPWFTWLGNTVSSLHPTTVFCFRVERSCVQIEHACICPTLCCKLCGLPEMQQFCLCVMLLNATHDIGLCSRIEHWRTVMDYSP